MPFQNDPMAIQGRPVTSSTMPASIALSSRSWVPARFATGEERTVPRSTQA